MSSQQAGRNLVHAPPLRQHGAVQQFHARLLLWPQASHGGPGSTLGVVILCHSMNQPTVVPMKNRPESTTIHLGQLQGSHPPCQPAHYRPQPRPQTSLTQMRSQTRRETAQYSTTPRFSG